MRCVAWRLHATTMAPEHDMGAPRNRNSVASLSSKLRTEDIPASQIARPTSRLNISVPPRPRQFLSRNTAKPTYQKIVNMTTIYIESMDIGSFCNHQPLRSSALRYCRFAMRQGKLPRLIGSGCSMKYF
jgi:hypothetical protein